MNASKFTSLPAREKKKIVSSAIQGANRDQENLMKRYKKTFATKPRSSSS